MIENQPKLTKLKYHVFPSGPVPESSIDLHNKVYGFWQTTWQKTLGELEGLERLHSDDFMRQGEATAFTVDNEVIAYFAFSWFDLRLEASTGHSYFDVYPKETLDLLRSRGLNKAMTMGWLSVAPAWRKSVMGPTVCQAMLWQGYQRFLSSDSDVLIAYTRNDRKINDLCYQYGSRCLKSDLRSHNVAVDLIWTLREDIRPNADETIRNTAANLWNQRTIHTDAFAPAQQRRAA